MNWLLFPPTAYTSLTVTLGRLVSRCFRPYWTPTNRLYVVCILLIRLMPPTAGAQCTEYGAYIRWVGGAHTGGVATAIDVQGTMAHIADLELGLLTFDVSDPRHPVLLSAILQESGPRDVDIDGHLAYVANDIPGLSIVDVSEPSKPLIVGNLTLPTIAMDVWTNGNLACIADRDNGYFLVDVSNPTSPVVLGIVDTPGDCLSVDVRGTLLFTADDFHIIDISVPTAPQILSTVITPGPASSVAASTEHAYVASGTEGLLVYSVIDPVNPQLIGSMTIPDQPHKIALRSDNLYLAAGSLYIVSISDPALPHLIGTMRTGDVRHVALNDNFAFLADGNAGLQVADLSFSNPAPTLGYADTPGGALGVDLIGDIACVTDQSVGLQIFDVSSPYNPELLSSVSYPGIMDCVVHETLAYLADWTHNLVIVDISQPHSPVTISTLNGLPFTWAIGMLGDYVYLFGPNLRAVVDVADPATPTVVGSVPGGGDVTTVSAEGEFLYCLSSASGEIQIFDCSAPSKPALIGSVGIGAGIASFVPMGLYPMTDRLLAATSCGLSVVDVSDPTSPVVLATHATPNLESPFSRAVTVAGGFAYFADPSVGMLVWDISDLDSIQCVGTNFVNGNATGIAVSNEVAIVTCWGGGIRTLPLQCETPLEAPVFEIESDPLAIDIFPNPSTGEVRVAWNGRSSILTGADIYDCLGRHVKTIHDTRASSRSELIWNGTNDAGVLVAAGVYLFRASTPTKSSSARIIRVR